MPTCSNQGVPWQELVLDGQRVDLCREAQRATQPFPRIQRRGKAGPRRSRTSDLSLHPDHRSACLRLPTFAHLRKLGQFKNGAADEQRKSIGESNDSRRSGKGLDDAHLHFMRQLVLQPTGVMQTNVQIPAKCWARMCKKHSKRFRCLLCHGGIVVGLKLRQLVFYGLMRRKGQNWSGSEPA